MVRKSLLRKVIGSVFLTVILVGAPFKLVSVAELEESRDEIKEAQSFYTAMAGIHEAMARLATGEIQDPHNPPNPDWQVEIYPAPSPESRGDTLCIRTVQRKENFLPYCSSNDPLIIHYLLDGDGVSKKIVYYDPSQPEARSLNPDAGSLPIYVITSTGIEGSRKKTIQTEVVIQKNQAYLQGEVGRR